MVEAEPVLEVGAENSDKAGRFQQASTLKRRLETAITNRNTCNLWIKRNEFQPGCYSGFAVFAKNTSVKDSIAKQIGWVREDDKPLVLEFTNSIEFSSGVIRRENRGI